MLTTDVVVHTWDVARAVGAEVVLDPELCEVGLERALANRERLVASGMFGPPVPVPEDAPVQDRLLACLGRDPSVVPPS